MSDCGPVAALNVLKWAGMNLTYKDHISHLKNACCYTNNDEFAGVRWWDIKKALSEIGKDLICVRKCEVKNLGILTRHVFKGGSFILRYRTSPINYHYSAVVGNDDGKTFLWLNHLQEYPQIEATPEQFEEQIMSKSKFGDIPIALLIRKI